MIDYKKIIKSRNTRLAILRFFSFIPDKWMLRLQYRIKTGRRLDLKHPKRYSEKIQWYKLNHHDPLMIRCVDKADVRGFVADCGLSDILVPLIGVYEHVEDIDFKALPQQFVIKNTLGGGGNSVIICKDKSTLDWEAVKARMRSWLDGNSHRKNAGREWPYYSGKDRRILIEAYIDPGASVDGLVDYKFFCFQGRVHFLYVVADRVLGRDGAFGIYDRDFRRLPYTRVGDRVLREDFEKPQGFETMIEVAEKLSEPFPHTRIDLYDQNGTILFGEITFYNASGYVKFDPDEFDLLAGSAFILSEKKGR